jgi:hypothetical protein
VRPKRTYPRNRELENIDSIRRHYCEQRRSSHLSRRSAALLCDRLDYIDDLLVVLVCIRLEAWECSPAVVRCHAVSTQIDLDT